MTNYVPEHKTSILQEIDNKLCISVRISLSSNFIRMSLSRAKISMVIQLTDRLRYNVTIVPFYAASGLRVNSDRDHLSTG